MINIFPPPPKKKKKLVFSIWSSNLSFPTAVSTPRKLWRISVSFAFHVLSYSHSSAVMFPTGWKVKLKTLQPMQLSKRKVATSSPSILELFCTYHFTSVRSLATAQRISTCGFEACGFITRTTSITVNLVNFWFSMLPSFSRKSHITLCNNITGGSYSFLGRSIIWLKNFTTLLKVNKTRGSQLLLHFLLL